MKLPWSKGSERPSNAALETAKPKKRRRLRRSGLRLGVGQLLLVLGFTIATTAAGVYTVYSQYQVVKLGYALDQQLFDYRRELEASKRLNLSISSYKHPSAVSAFADEALDMRQPSNADELIVPAPKRDDDDVVDESIPVLKVEGAADPVVRRLKEAPQGAAEDDPANGATASETPPESPSAARDGSQEPPNAQEDNTP